MYDPTGHQPGAVPSRVLTALRGETQRLDASVSYASLSPAERAQDRAESCLSDLTLALLSRGADPTAHAQRMAVATHAAAQALLSAYVLWRAEAEAGGSTVPSVTLAPLGREQDRADPLGGLAQDVVASVVGRVGHELPQGRHDPILDFLQGDVGGVRAVVPEQVGEVDQRPAQQVEGDALHRRLNPCGFFAHPRLRSRTARDVAEAAYRASAQDGEAGR